MTAERSPIAAEIRATCAVAAPLAAANLAQMAMHVTNAVMVGHLGAVSLAAAGLGAALYSSLLMTSQGVLTAVAPLAAHAIGADDHPTLGGIAGAGLIVAALLAAPVVAILTAFPLLLAGFGYDPELVAGIGIYLRAIAWGAPAFLGFAVLRFLLVAAFRARVVMVVSLTAVPLNSALNWVLIFGHFGCWVWHSGSAWATAIVMADLFLPPDVDPTPDTDRSVACTRDPHPAEAGAARCAGELVVTTGILMGLLGIALGAQAVFNVPGCFRTARPRPGGDRSGRLPARDRSSGRRTPGRVCRAGARRGVHDGERHFIVHGAQNPCRPLSRSR